MCENATQARFNPQECSLRVGHCFTRGGRREEIANSSCSWVFPTLAQAPVERIVLLPKSNLDTSPSVAEGFAKYCPNVQVTENADYILEAVEKTSYSDGGSYRRGISPC